MILSVVESMEEFTDLIPGTTVYLFQLAVEYDGMFWEHFQWSIPNCMLEEGVGYVACPQSEK